jgi:nicotinate-nucleotide--dimethylbenzimidazole phosphoribosyltransferase
MLLAAMLRASAPAPRTAASTVEAPVEAPLEEVLVPLRRRDYQRAEQLGDFQAFGDRSATREGAPGRPGRRLAAQVTYAAPVAAALPEAASAVVALVLPTPVLRGTVEASPPDASQPANTNDTGPSPEVAEAPMPTSLVPMPPAPAPEIAEVGAPPVPVMEVPTVAESIPDREPTSRALTHAGLEAVAVELGVVEPVVVEHAAVDPVAVEPVAIEPTAAEPSPLASELAERFVAEAPAVTTEVPGLSPLPLDVPEADRPHEPEIMVLARRAALPALAPLMTREVTLGDAARALRAALPAALTMTDGRQLRRVVAVGAATSVVAAAFAIRGRKHR